MFFRIPFRVKLVLLFVLVLVLSALAIASFSVYSARKAIEQDQKAALSEMTNLVTSNVTRMIKDINTRLNELSENEATLSFLAQADPEGLPALKDIAEATFRSLQHVNKLYLFWDNEVYLPLEERRMGKDTGKLTEWIEKSAEYTANTHWELPVNHALEEPHEEDERCVYIMHRLNDPEEKGRTGFWMLELSHREFLPLLLSNPVSLNHQYHLIFDQNMRIVAANRSFDKDSNEKIRRGLREGAETLYLGNPAKRYFIRQQYEGLSGWTLVCIQAASAAFPSSAELIRLVAQFTVITTILTSLIVIFITTTITRPIHAVRKAMKKFVEGDFSVRVHPRGTDEMGQLMRSFNSMADQIDHLIHEVYLSQIAYKEAKISALQAQINPHFLYNTLDSMQWLLISHGELEVAEAIAALGEIFRYSTDADEAFVRLEQELHFLKDYLNIQKFRLEEKLSVTWNMPEDLLSFIVPRLILQPLIENAIKYGASSDGKINLTIAVREVDEKLEISVRDCGHGFDASEALNIKKMIKADGSFSEKHGLRNVNKRLKLLFGEAFGLNFQSEPGKGSCFWILLPMLRNIPRKREEGNLV